MFYELSRLAINNMLRARARLIMTAGGVLVGTAAVILLVALTFGLQKAAEAGLGESTTLTDIDVYPNYGYFPGGEEEPEEIPQLTQDAIQAFWQIPGVELVIPTLGIRGGADLRVGDYRGGGWIQGVDPQLLSYLGITAAQGELTLNPGEIIVGPEVGNGFYDPAAEEYEPIIVDMFSDPVTLGIYLPDGEEEQDIRVSAVLEPGTNYDYAVLMAIDDVMILNQAFDTSGEEQPIIYDSVKVRASSRESVSDIIDAVRELGFQAGGMIDYINQLNGFFSTMRLMLGGVGGVALLVAAFGVANTMTMAILERTKEIGLMKAIGARDRDVLTIFLIEAGGVGLVGGVSGVMVAIGLQQLVNQAIANAPQSQDGINFLPIDPTQIGGNLMIIPSELIIFALILATTVGIGAGLYPALRAANLPPVVALKTE